MSNRTFIIMEKRDGSILIIDDNYDILISVQVFLKRFFSNVQVEQVPDNIIRQVCSGEFDVILLDMNFTKGKKDGTEGFFWLDKILTESPDTIIILITAWGDVDIAIKAIKRGATDFVLKPWKNQKLLATVISSFELSMSRREIRKLKITQKNLVDDSISKAGEFVGESIAINKIFYVVDKVAPTDADVLILGENGTGKELIARKIHKKSSRNNNVFISVDLGSLSESLFESELFGHKKGAFTDAKEDKTGRFELASSGTIFLDEIGNLSLPMQSKLLTVLQKKTVMRVGSVKEITVDFRLICATNMNLYNMVKSGKFREDLLYRINTVEITVPPLRERKADIPLLFDHFFNKFKNKYKKTSLKYHPGLVLNLNKYDWPGNIRELEHSIERAVILSEGNNLTIDSFSRGINQHFSSEKKELISLEDMEKDHIIRVIAKNNGNITKAALDLGISRTAVHRRIRKYEI